MTGCCSHYTSNGSPYQAGLLAGIDLDALPRRQDDGDVERARQIYAWCAERGVEVGAMAVQVSMRQPRIGATLVGPRTAAELEDNIRHATADIGCLLYTSPSPRARG